MMGVSSNFGNMFSVIGAVIFLPFLPMLPIQILLNNLIYDFSQLTIPNDNVDPHYIQKPKRWNMKFVKKFMLLFGLISSFFDYVTFFLLFYLFRVTAAQFQTGWFIESLATQTLIILIIRTSLVPFIQSKPAISLLLSTVFAVAFGWSLPFLIPGAWFGLVPLNPIILATLFGVVVTYLITVEIVKQWFYRRIEY
jgi:Mg2+-importing ATPase